MTTPTRTNPSLLDPSLSLRLVKWSDAEAEEDVS